MTPAKSANTAVNYDIENEVLERYKAGAKDVQPSLCCPTSYNGNYLEILPSEIIEKDYGCGDPTQYINSGELVVDLGSGAGKNCYIIAQKVGKDGRVIGVDFNDDMLALSRKYQDEIADKLGYKNTEFVKGKIQDLGLNLAMVQTWLNDNPITSIEDVSRFEAMCDRLRQEQPLIPDVTVDVVVSNCVLNLVKSQDKLKLFAEIYRVLKVGGRAVISDIVCDEPPTQKIINDPELWSGCIAGAFQEHEFLQMFENAGFYGVEILTRQTEPWQVIDGIEFRSVTVCAYKGKEGPCLECHQAVIYKGPWKQVVDDDGHTLYRGQPMAVCDQTFNIYTRSPYSDDIIPIPPYQNIDLKDAKEFDCRQNAIRDPKLTKGENYHITNINNDGSCCSPSSCC
ncbi:methyltransferase domain-containing protein [Arthrospira platensis]|jgi:SAM-dependent methyltransferase|uniref:Arsenite methyltransferase n=1 Tax=Limnospira platensis NIES-46 TaxID=1236695 RepID=A0A5M3T393_LIMPL|nr:methyltransferase domain-containing protein [Arthrospira platensis]AMW29050.1 methyltransferase [Arthrospira platensis YZ]KDR55023.1 methyltransferase [Arthrospira platensis str. Paraca]MBD2667827.1 methyltransferase domain-containing protein [Arthrospira platensis FACHB-439]MBD2708638.1 methyltransferase domain-containing protein [Arthrospira platensis FACHB-835]MDF2212874.1 methyltransferase domain-containing protein [Arthrospira platensis NCB002]MDT9182825.1 methyltransferase domain-con